MVKRLILRLHGVEEGAEIQTKCIRNLFTEIIEENLSILWKDMDIQVWESSRTPNRWTRKETLHPTIANSVVKMPVW
jgi:hypothetical protein